MREVERIEKYIPTPENFQNIKEICRDFEYFDAYTEFFEDSYYNVYCMWMDQRIVGISVFSRHSYAIYGNFLWVDENYRNKGIGTKLLQFIEIYAKNKGYKAIQGDSISTNEKAHNFYIKHGAEKFGEYDNIYGKGSELMYMFRKKILENIK